MPFSKDILVKRLTLVASIYFMLLGLFDIGMDIWHGTLSWFIPLFNLAFFIPIIFRKQQVNLFMGAGFTVLWGYLLFAGTISMSKNPDLPIYEIYGVAFFLAFSFLCSLTLIWSGIHINSEEDLSNYKIAEN